jgi:hypothetical protein
MGPWCPQIEPVLWLNVIQISGQDMVWGYILVRTLECSQRLIKARLGMISNDETSPRQTAPVDPWWTLVELDLFGEPDSQQRLVDCLAEAVQGLASPAAHLERLQSAMARATLSALEHSRMHESEAPPIVRVLIPKRSRPARTTDPTCTEPIQLRAAQGETQQRGPKRSHGWNFFQVEKTMQDPGHKARRLIELFLYPAGEKYDATDD